MWVRPILRLVLTKGGNLRPVQTGFVSQLTGSFRRELLDRCAKFGYTVTSIEPAPPDGPFTKPIEIVKVAKLL